MRDSIDINQSLELVCPRRVCVLYLGFYIFTIDIPSMWYASMTS